MLKFINLKNLTAKTLISILMIGGLVTPAGTKKAVATEDVQGIELRYHHSDFKCSTNGVQADIQVYIYDQENTLLETLSKGESFVSSSIDSIADLKLRYKFNNVNCISIGDYYRYAYTPKLNSYSSGEGWRQYNIPPDYELLEPLEPGKQLPSYLSNLGTYSADQTSVSNLFQNLDSYEELLLVELATDNTSSSLYDLQDVVLIVDNNPESLVRETENFAD